jgi:hypothetical protein
LDFELLDDKMQAGYRLRAPRERAAACKIWLEAWNDALGIFDKSGMQSIREFDERFKGTEFLFNWIQDLENALWSAGLKDRQFLTARVAVCAKKGCGAFTEKTTYRSGTGGEPWRSRISNWARPAKRESCIAIG